jgi:uncharacterized protein (DUF4415 family)
MSKADDLIREVMAAGRRQKDDQLEKVTLRLSNDVIVHFRRRYGRMWQAEMNSIMRERMKSEKDQAKGDQGGK